MLQSLNLPLYSVTKADYGSWDALREDCRRLGCDGVEGIWAGEEIPTDFPAELLTGYHLTFFPDWLDFYREDKAALLQKFGSMDAVRSFYGGFGPNHLLNIYREDLARAVSLGTKYVVFHVSDISLEEGYTYRWLHSDQEVIDTSIEIINLLLKDVPPTFDFLVENQWWPGLTLTDPKITENLLLGIHFMRKGLMLDTGHLMNTKPSIRTQADGLRYIHGVLDRHRDLLPSVRGIHLHQSLSGPYVRRHIGALPEDFPTDCTEQFIFSYQHILQIDRHRPWTHPGVAELVDRVSPAYLTHELSASNRSQRFTAARRQINTLRGGQK